MGVDSGYLNVYDNFLNFLDILLDFSVGYSNCCIFFCE